MDLGDRFPRLAVSDPLISTCTGLTSQGHLQEEELQRLLLVPFSEGLEISALSPDLYVGEGRKNPQLQMKHKSFLFNL